MKPTMAAGLASLTLILLASTNAAFGQSVAGLRVFETKCGNCHQSAAPKAAPNAATLRKMTPEYIYAALAKPPHSQISDLSEEDKQLVTAYLGGRKIGVSEIASAKLMPNKCAAKGSAGDLLREPMWNGWGNDATTNARFQTGNVAELKVSQVPSLKLKWAFGLPLTDEANSQPTVVGGRIYIGSDSGTVYALDAKTGCVYWSFQADGAMRSAISIGGIKTAGAAKYAAYFGDQKAYMYAVDADSGSLLWKVKVDEHPVAQITGSPTLYEGRLYVPMASAEERAAGLSMTYGCCTFRGSMTALDANTGKQIWKTYVIPEGPKPTFKNAQGVQHYGPAGGALWAAATIDPKNHALYVGTGDAYTRPADKNTDAVMALDIDSGKVLWSVQDTVDDAWLSGCGGGGSNNPDGISENCPKPLGPDFDFGSSMILRTLPDGHRVLIAGQKSGMVWAHDPDQQGKVMWKTQLVDKLALGMITFGGAADDENAYFGLRSGGIAAVSLATGEKKWFTALPGQTPNDPANGETAALTAIPGVVFSGGWDGVLRALSTKDGHALWEFSTAKDFVTVNHVKANGGTMGAPGPTIVDGMLFVSSGYLFTTGSMRGNVLLAFSAQ